MKLVSHALSIRRVCAGLILFAVFLSGMALAQTKPVRKELGLRQPPKSILFVGPTLFYYNNGLHAQVLRLARAADPANAAQYRYTSVMINGSSLDWHDMKSYLRPNGLAKYTFTDDNEIVFNTADKVFEVVVMADCSLCPLLPQLRDGFFEAVRRQTRIVSRHSMRPVLFMTWAFQNKPEMTAPLAEQYTLAGNENDALVIPAGLAFAKAIARRPALDLYAPDKRNPSPAGTYLAACASYATLYQKSPVGNPYIAGLDAATAQFLQTVAWDTVQEYFGR